MNQLESLQPQSESVIPFYYPRECTLVPISAINQEDRSRTDYSHVPELAQSIKKHGLIHPPTLEANGRLIAGGSRIAAMVLLQSPLIPVLYRESLSQADVAEMELVENFQRRGMKWQETLLNIYKVHQIRVRDNILFDRQWLQRETGALLGYTNAHVSNAIKVAQYLIAGDEEITNCDGVRKALDILAARAETKALQELAQRTSTALGFTSAPTPTRTSPGVGFTIDLDGDSAPSPSTSDLNELLGAAPRTPNEVSDHIIQSDEPLPEKYEGVDVDFSRHFYLGDSVDIMMGWDAGCVDHIVTDPPYAIEMSNLTEIKHIEKTTAEHKVTENLELLPKFLRAAYHVLKENSFCVFWYDMEHHSFLVEQAQRAGFTVQRWPLVWIKTHTCKNGAPFHNFTKATEAAMVCRKGSPKLQKPCMKNYIMADGLTERKMYDHPFVKPRDVWNFILEHIAHAGQTILDPFAGQMSGPRAVLNLGMRPLAIELNPYHFMRGVENMHKLWKDMSMGRVRVVNNPINNITPEMLGPYTPNAEEQATLTGDE